MGELAAHLCGPLEPAQGSEEFFYLQMQLAQSILRRVQSGLCRPGQQHDCVRKLLPRRSRISEDANGDAVPWTVRWSRRGR